MIIPKKITMFGILLGFIALAMANLGLVEVHAQWNIILIIGIAILGIMTIW